MKRESRKGRNDQGNDGKKFCGRGRKIAYEVGQVRRGVTFNKRAEIKKSREVKHSKRRRGGRIRKQK